MAGRLGAIVFALMALVPGVARATTITVTSPADSNLPNDPLCSLREAVDAANTNAAFGGCPAGDPTARDTIVLSATTYPFAILHPLEIGPGGPVTIAGQGTASTTISVIGRGFTVDPGADLTLRALTVTNGQASGGSTGSLTFDPMTGDTSCSGDATPGADGGAILNSGTLTLDHVTISNSFAGAGGDGASSVGVGNVVTSPSCFNGANGGRGGAIASNGILTVTDSTFSDNGSGVGGSADYGSAFGGSGGNGGAIFIYGGSASISGSTFTGNVAGGGQDGGDTGGGGGNGGNGGAIYAIAPVTVSDSTLTGNSAGAGGSPGAHGSAEGVGGGGGAVAAEDGVISVVDSTLTANTAGAAGSGGDAGSGSAILRIAGTMSYAGSILTGAAPACSGSVSGASSIASDSSCPGASVADPQLGALQNNGGPTQTMLPAATSPAVDNTPGPTCPTPTDQRGFARPQGSGCDAGAVERRAVKFTLTPNPTAFGNVRVGTQAAPREATLTYSSGEDPVMVGAASLTGSSEFSLVSDACKNVTLAVGTTCHVSTKFAPTAPGAATATLSVSAPGNPHTALTGTGTTTGGGAKKPVVRSLSQSAKRWRLGSHLATISKKKRPPVGTTFTFTLSTAASVKLAFMQTKSGRSVGGKCVAKNRHNARRPRCKLTVLAGALRLTGHAGVDHVKFQGRLSPTSKLKPGAYALFVSARNAAGTGTPAGPLRFTIVR
jgi:CSLREA domain-containing protein